MQRFHITQIYLGLDRMKVFKCIFVSFVTLFPDLLLSQLRVIVLDKTFFLNLQFIKVLRSFTVEPDFWAPIHILILRSKEMSDTNLSAVIYPYKLKAKLSMMLLSNLYDKEM